MSSTNPSLDISLRRRIDDTLKCMELGNEDTITVVALGPPLSVYGERPVQVYMYRTRRDVLDRITQCLERDIEDVRVCRFVLNILTHGASYNVAAKAMIKSGLTDLVSRVVLSHASDLVVVETTASFFRKLLFYLNPARAEDRVLFGEVVGTLCFLIKFHQMNNERLVNDFCWCLLLATDAQLSHSHVRNIRSTLKELLYYWKQQLSIVEHDPCQIERSPLFALSSEARVCNEVEELLRFYE